MVYGWKRFRSKVEGDKGNEITKRTDRPTTNDKMAYIKRQTYTKERNIES